MPELEDKIRTRTEAFAKRLATLLRQAALEGAAAALSKGTAAEHRRGRSRETTTNAPTTKAGAARRKGGRASRGATSSSATPKRTPGQKRSHAELAALVNQLGDYVKANPGSRMEAISKALGASAPDLRFPMMKLVRANRVRTEGQKQNTAYFPT